jgi:hypothetical protein
MFAMRLLRAMPVLVLILLIGCDSTDPRLDDVQAPADVVGSYTFVQLRFEPDAAVLPPFNLLDSLADDTRMQLFNTSDLVLTLSYRSGALYPVFGTFTVSAGEVRLRLTSGAGNNHPVRKLLGSELLLHRDPAAVELLSANVRKTVDLSELSAQYAGIPPVSGTLRIRLRR